MEIGFAWRLPANHQEHEGVSWIPVPGPQFGTHFGSVFRFRHTGDRHRAHCDCGLEMYHEISRVSSGKHLCHQCETYRSPKGGFFDVE